MTKTPRYHVCLLENDPALGRNMRELLQYEAEEQGLKVQCHYFPNLDKALQSNEDFSLVFVDASTIPAKQIKLSLFVKRHSTASFAVYSMLDYYAEIALDELVTHWKEEIHIRRLHIDDLNTFMVEHLKGGLNGKQKDQV